MRKRKQKTQISKWNKKLSKKAMMQVTGGTSAEDNNFAFAA